MKSIKSLSVTQFFSLMVLCLTLNLATLPSSHAIFLEADSLQSNGVNSTIDIWFFSFTGVGPNTNNVQVSDVSGFFDLDLDMIIYIDDGTFSNVFAMDTAMGTDPNINTFPVGDYIAVIGNHPLAVGELGPFQADASLGQTHYDYEFNGLEPNNNTEISINCVLSGNLDGTFTTRVLNSNTCYMPVSEPSGFGFWLLAASLLLLTKRARFV